MHELVRSLDIECVSTRPRWAHLARPDEVHELTIKPSSNLATIRGVQYHRKAAYLARQTPEATYHERQGLVLVHITEHKHTQGHWYTSPNTLGIHLQNINGWVALNLD